MSVFAILKRIAIRPFFRRTPIEILGKEDSWGIRADLLGPESTVLSAGVGKNISFEQELSERYGCRILLLDPSPTGIATMKSPGRERPNIDFEPLGLAATSGRMAFSYPADATEGSFRKASGSEAGPVLEFDCISIVDLMRRANVGRVDLLKIDIEGFEYEVLQGILDQRLDIRQICVEIHTSQMIPTDRGLLDAYWLIVRLFLSGYRIVYNAAMDFTFVRGSLLQEASA